MGDKQVLLEEAYSQRNEGLLQHYQASSVSAEDEEHHVRSMGFSLEIHQEHETPQKTEGDR